MPVLEPDQGWQRSPLRRDGPYDRGAAQFTERKRRQLEEVRLDFQHAALRKGASFTVGANFDDAFQWRVRAFLNIGHCRLRVEAALLLVGNVRERTVQF